MDMSGMLKQNHKKSEESPLQMKKISFNAMHSNSDGNSLTKHDRYGPTISSLSNFSIQYNLGVIAPALLLLDHRSLLNTNSTNQSEAVYPRTDNMDSLLKSVVFVGSIFGQCTMGFVGDYIGLERAMILTNLLSFIGTFGCTLAPFFGASDYNLVYTIIAISRGILGVGIGGKYPLGSAISAKAAESNTENNSIPNQDLETRAKSVAHGFFWQTPGAIIPYIMSLLLLVFTKLFQLNLNVTNIKWQYVVLVGFGGIPSALIVYFSFLQLQQIQYIQNRNVKKNIFAALKKNIYWKKLMGTGISWALYDFIYYGTAFNLPDIISNIFSNGNVKEMNELDLLLENSFENAFVSSMGIPGVVAAIYMLEPMGGPKPLQSWGFIMIGVSSLLIAILSYAEQDKGNKLVAFLVCSFLIFALNWGCNVSTYVLPVETFPREIRSSFHGVSAGMGKLGALFGSYFFGQLNKISISFTFCICSIFCGLGVLITWAWIDPPFENLFFVKTNTQMSRVPLDDHEEEIEGSNEICFHSFQIENI